MNNYARAFLITLRIAIGWHFLYEGLFKIDSDTGAVMYAASRYPLQAATGRLRDYFNSAAPGTLQLQPSLARIDAWNDEIVRVFKGRQPLSEDQKAKLNDLADKMKLAVAQAAREQSSGENIVNFDWPQVHEEVLKLAPESEGDRFTSLGYLQSSAGPLRPLFRSLVSDIDGLERLTAASAQTRLDRRYEEILDHFKSAGKPFTEEQQKKLAAARDAQKAAIAETVNSPAFQMRRADYANMRRRIKEDESSVTAQFSRERVAADRKKLDVIAGEMLGSVNEPLSELAVQMQAIATVDQLGAGPLPRPSGPADWVDISIKLILTAIGVCLMLGLFTPVAAIAAAGQLAMFYFASPPWPGLPAASTAGHYLYIDRNFIEAIAALLIASTPSGRWAGLDFYLRKFSSAVLARHGSGPQIEPRPVGSGGSADEAESLTRS